jgi:hypothetical protein
MAVVLAIARFNASRQTPLYKASRDFLTLPDGCDVC